MSPSSSMRKSGTSYLRQARRSTPTPKAKPVYTSGSMPTFSKTLGSTMPQPRSRPSRVLAEAAPLATADAARDIGLGARLGKGEEVRAKARLALLAEELLDEVVERALEITEGDALVHNETLNLVELRQVRGIGDVVAVHLARADHVDGGLLLLHDVHLRTGCLRAQQYVAFAPHRALLATSIDYVESVLHRTARMILGSVERREVIPVGLDLATTLDLVADAGKDVSALANDAVDEMLAADGHATPGQRDIDGTSRELGVELGGLEQRLALVERPLRSRRAPRWRACRQWGAPPWERRACCATRW